MIIIDWAGVHLNLYYTKNMVLYYKCLNINEYSENILNDIEIAGIINMITNK